jgi:hypothetical protein
MSAFGTKKPGGDRAVQLTFPAEFQKAFDAGYAFFPSDMGHSLDLMVGSDFQATYHEEKRMDANKSVMNGLQARRTMEQKLLTGHQNYHLPKPVLGQRKFANPMNGVVGFSSARRDGMDAPFSVVESGMRGGVVVTPEGQEFYKMALKRRMDELNRINALAQGFAVPMGQRVQTFRNQDVGAPDKVEFFTLLRGLMDTVTEGDFTRFSFEALKDLMKMLFKFAPTATEDDFDDILDGLDIIDAAYRKYETQPELKPGSGFEEYGESVRIYVQKARQYTTEMYKNINLAPRDRKTLSDTLLRSLGINRLVTKRTEVDAIKDEARRSTRVRDGYENFDGRYGGDGDDDGGGDGRFNRPAMTREDEDAGGAPRAPLAGNNGDPNRERFGQRRGVLVPPTFFGEEREEEENQLVAPLGLAGFDPNAQIPAQDPERLRKAVSDELEAILREAGWDGTGTMDGFVEENYEEDDLANAVESRMLAKTFTKAQIAKGMEGMRKPFFAAYVAANTGEIEPAPQQRAVPARPIEAPVLGEGGGLDFTRRDVLRMNTDQLAALGRRLDQYGMRKYNPRPGTKRRSMLASIINRIKADYPDF